jgi:hypothetical protein
VQSLAVELGRRLRTALGEDRPPALGWDASKFTARAAAACAAAGSVRLVGKADEARFLAPLPVSLLPLPAPARQQLHWLGIRTLGQYAALPATAVWQRWGQVGKLAQCWAQGKDRRPVCGGVRALPEPIRVDLEPRAEQIGRVLADLVQALRGPLRTLAGQMAGVRRLRVTLHFLPTAMRTLDVTFVEPASQEWRVQAALAHHLQALVWPGAVARVEASVLDVGELVAGQLPLFGSLLEGGEDGAEGTPLAELAQRWTGRYGRCFFVGQVTDACHPVPERVYRLQAV